MIIRNGSCRIRKKSIHLTGLGNDLIQLRIDSLNPGKCPHCAADLLRRTLFSLLQKALRVLQCLIDSAEGRQGPVSALQLLVFFPSKLRALYFIYLIGQKVRLPGSCRRIEILLCGRLFLPSKITIQSSHLRQKLCGLFPRVLIEHLELCFPSKEPLVLPLPVNIDPKLGELPQLMCGHSLSADTALRSSGIDLPLDEHGSVLIRLDIHCLQLLSLAFVVNTKKKLHKRKIRPGPDQTLIRLRAECKIDGAKKDGFSGSGFTGQNVQSILKGNLFLFDECQIFHMKSQQHAAPSSFPY